MKKSDLRTGMLVTLRNKESYYVLLNTGLCAGQQDILAHNVGDETGWLSLCNYADDLTYHDDPDGIFPSTPEQDRWWDIMEIAIAPSAGTICNRKGYRSAWTREETH